MGHALREDRVRDVAELEDGQDASRFQHPVRLLDNLVRVRAIPDAERDGVQVERVVRELLEAFGVAEVEGYLRGCEGRKSAL